MADSPGSVRKCAVKVLKKTETLTDAGYTDFHIFF